MPKFCTNCGSSLAEGVRFCNKCGAAIAPTQPPQAAPPSAPPPPLQAPSYQPLPVSQPPAQAAGAGLQPNAAGLLCYALGLITGIIFLVLEPYNKDRFVRFHAFQSIFFSVAMIILHVIMPILWMVLPWPLDSLLWTTISLGGFLLWLFLMYKAYNREEFKLPLIGDLARQQAGPAT
jgi:uncharacterized membrane protein